MRWRYSNSALSCLAGVVPVLALITLAGCELLTGPSGEWNRRIGVIIPGSPEPWNYVLAAPAAVQARVPFEVSVTTRGSRSCTRPSGADVQYREEPGGPVAEITPYDEYREGEGVVCTADLHGFARTVTLRFEAPGNATVRVRGRSTKEHRGLDPEIITVERRITVQ